jgi:hypothetical protein
MIPTINSDYFLKQRFPANLCKGEVLCLFAVRTEFFNII